jgi:TetR/AcrR family transcriptional regulator, transcriptional repressor for nem operon
MCLCGMLAADYHTLPEPMRQAVITFFDHNEKWVAGIIDKGRRNRSLHVDRASREVAHMIIGTLEGTMLIARTYEDPDRFGSAARRLLAEFTTNTTN